MGNMFCTTKMQDSSKIVHWAGNTQDRFVPSGETLLTMTAQEDKADLMIEYIKQGASVNQPNVNGNTPLHVAIRARNEEIVEILIAHFADVNIRDRSGLTPLHLACLIENEEIANRLLRAGSCPDGILDGKYYVSTPLMTAVENKDADMACLLLKNGAKINERDWWQNSALLKAVQCGSIELVCLLLSHGADPNVVNRFGGSALHYSTIADHCQITRELVKAGCKLDWFGKDDLSSTVRYSPLAAAIHRGCFSCFNFFLDAGADINKEDVKGKTPLVYAITNRSWSCNNYHYRYVPQCFHNAKPTCVDSLRLNFAKELINRGADLYTVWDFVIWQIRHPYLQFEDQQAIMLCIQAMGFVHKEKFKVETLFRTLALRNQIEAMYLLFIAGYLPSEEDVNIALSHQNMRDNERKVIENVTCSINWIHNIRSIPRTLKNLSVITIRESLSSNVISSVEHLNLPNHLRNLITLEI